MPYSEVPGIDQGPALDKATKTIAKADPKVPFPGTTRMPKASTSNKKKKSNPGPDIFGK